MKTPAPAPTMHQTLDRARAAQQQWAGIPVPMRLALIRDMRCSLARRAQVVGDQLSAALPQRRGTAETLAAELLPLLDGWRFLERQGRRILKPRHLGAAGRPIWLHGARATVHRDPKGVVLIVCPFNFPLMLGGVPLGQALAAGNAVLLKPGRLGSDAARLLAQTATDSGVPPGLVQVLGHTVEAGHEAIAAGVDHVVMTGSSDAGRAIMRACAEHLTPMTMELSGCDALFVQDGAELEKLAQCVSFGLALNSGATCIAPRRAWVNRSCYAQVRDRLAEQLQRLAQLPADPAAVERVAASVNRAEARGAKRVAGEIRADGVKPLLLAEVPPDDELLDSDLFAPVLSLVSVDSDEQALDYNSRCGYRLGASVFGPLRQAAALAARVDAGVVTVNDLIVPTADPRLPFAGRGRSGFGVTRAREGLLELTQPRTVVHRPARFPVHLLPARADDAQRLDALIRVLHGRWRDRPQALRQLINPARG